MMFLLVISTLTLSFKIQIARADGGTIYINADGSMSPSTAPIYSADNITYTLTGNITANANGIVIERDNIVVDGANYTVTGSGSGNGTTLTNRSNVTIRNMTIKNFYSGIWLDSSSYNTLSGNNITANNQNGILLMDSSNSTLSGNSVVANNDYGILLSDSSNSTLSGNDVEDNSYGVLLSYSSNSTLSGNSVANNGYGILLMASSNSTLSGNDVTANYGEGVGLGYSSDNNVLSGNNITENFRGISLSSSYDTLFGNNITANNAYGVLLGYHSNGNVLSGNNVTANNEYGIELYYSSNNTVCHNSFINNAEHVHVDTPGYANSWDDGYPSGGNYWSGFSNVDVKSGPYQNDTGSDGIVDTPHVMDANNTDRYPLVHPWSLLPVHNMNTGLGYATIQEAINANETLDKHTIFVEAGTYSETVTVNKTVALIGEGRETTTVDWGIMIEANDVTVSEFTVRNNHFVDNAHGIWLEGSNCLVSNNIMRDCLFEGMFLDGRNGGLHGNTVVNNSFLNNRDCGILLWSCNDSLIESNVANGNYFGIYAFASCRNSIENNQASNNTDLGIAISFYSSANFVINNTVLNNGWEYYQTDASGICLKVGCVSNLIVGNNVTGNVVGLYERYESNGNIIYHNSFVNNGVQVNYDPDFPCENVWDNGYPSGGNYWSDYTGSDSFFGTYQNLTGSDGIGDTPCNIDVNNVDHYPLMSPYYYWSNPISGDTNRDMKVDIGDISTVLDAFGSYPTHPRWNPNADTNSDGRIDMADIIIVLTNFGQHYP
jgi:parallel beta-helix repeat protein